jgi:hypothetical protein
MPISFEDWVIFGPKLFHVVELFGGGDNETGSRFPSLDIEGTISHVADEQLVFRLIELGIFRSRHLIDPVAVLLASHCSPAT